MQNSDREFKGLSVYFILLNYTLFINTTEFMNLFGEIEVNNQHDAYTWIRWK